MTSRPGSPLGGADRADPLSRHEEEAPQHSPLPERSSAQMNAILSALEARLERQDEELRALRQTARDGIDVQALGSAIANSTPAKEKDHSRDLEKEMEFSGDETPFVHSDDFMNNIKSAFELKNTPDRMKVQLIVGKLRGTALEKFKAFKNAAGDTGNRKTTTWTEFEDFAKARLAKDPVVERDKIQMDFHRLEQRTSAEAFSLAFSKVVTRIRGNELASRLHTDEELIYAFLGKLKTEVQSKLVGKEFKTLEEAYSEAIRHDNLVFAAVNRESRRNPRPPSSSRSGTPAPQPPPAQLQAILAALGYNVNIDNSRAPPGPLTADHLGSVERDHSVAPGQPVPRMTPEIKAWCIKHRACFRCRVKDAKHTANNCDRFPSHTPARIAAMEETASQGPTEQSND
mmetsp:Transcript_12497/g.24892  ORF Transcript_12497/g.24892 Transcript_12497/m.24892 type:complete len:401 (+) Transcript_12497:466-1668(+)